MSLDLPLFLPTTWDRFRNAFGFLGIREATGRQLECAISHAYDQDRRLLLGQLDRAFKAAGGQPGSALGDVLPFPRRAGPSRAKQPSVVRLPMRSAVVEVEPGPDTMAAD